MSLVLDASLALSWYFEDERTPAADALLDRVADQGATVPGLWRLEVANGLRTALQRRRIDKDFRDRAIAQLARLPITVDPDTDHYAWTNILDLADRFALTPYDAAYLELAQRLTLPLATRDEPLRAAAAALNVGLLGTST
ncbi:MAG: type II toxin-antitoxin system VapC family toxin [Alphaproteobacteria bacterium]|nr:type II toxin-antitoxin system VapC family toxin [Alphaproteobacteria bacterium]